MTTEAENIHNDKVSTIDDQEEGIQADDEDNDQIETERAVNPHQKRNQEMINILSSNPKLGSSAGFKSLVKDGADE